MYPALHRVRGAGDSAWSVHLRTGRPRLDDPLALDLDLDAHGGDTLPGDTTILPGLHAATSSTGHTPAIGHSSWSWADVGPRGGPLCRRILHSHRTQRRRRSLVVSGRRST